MHRTRRTDLQVRQDQYARSPTGSDQEVRPPFTKRFGMAKRCPTYGRVASSRAARCAIASDAVAPHISWVGRRLAQKAGRSGRPKIAQRMSGSSCTHRSPAFFPPGMPGIGEVIEGAMQHAPQCARQFMETPCPAPSAGGRSHRNCPAPASARTPPGAPATPCR